MNSLAIKFIKALIAFVILFIALLLIGSVAKARALDHAAIKRVVPIPNDNGNRASLFRSDVSQENLLGLERTSPFSLPISKHGMPMTASIATIDTIRVLALRIEFQPENPDNHKTTGNGTFDRRTYDEFVQQEGNYIDPAPHDAAYFESHMEALRRYWSFVSDGKLEITWDIYPQQGAEPLRLPNYMSYYGSEGPWADSSIGDKLGHFLIDAITYADSSLPQIDFSRYRALIIFHAGSDQQNNIAFINDTPDDFYTGFLRLSDPVYVDGGYATVQEGTLMPETASQDNRVTALNGVMAHEFGHQLGLPDLYNTSNFMTQVGDFSLMDNNGMSVGVELDSIGTTVGGTVPIYPDAWSRAYLGFDVPRVITEGVGDSISAAYLPYSDNEIIKIPVTEFEYFLVENRQVDPIHGSFLMGDPVTGVILGLGTDINGDQVPIGDYDIFVPGNGALIWHVDESVAYLDYTGSGSDNFVNNTLQWDSSRRFLSVVEADGTIDLGGYYYRGYGDDNDFWKSPNFRTFGPFTDPSSHTNLGADSHVSVFNFSASDTIMTADINVDWLMPGWPQFSIGQTSAPIIAHLGSDSSSQVLMAAGNELFIWNFDGSKFINNADSIGLIRYDGRDTLSYPSAVVAEVDTTIIHRPIVLDIDGDGINEIAVASASGNLYVYHLFDNDLDGRADLSIGYPLQMGNDKSSIIAVSFLPRAGQELFYFDDLGNGHITYNDLSQTPIDTMIFTHFPGISAAAAYSTNGENTIDLVRKIDQRAIIDRLIADTASLNFTPAFPDLNFGAFENCNITSADLDRDGKPEIIHTYQSGIGVIGSEGATRWSKNIGDSLGSPAFGDINADGYPEIVVVGNSKIYAFNYTGALLENFPINLGLYDLNGVIKGQPVLGDVNNDGKPDIIIGLPSGTIYAYDYHADRIAGFPLATSFAVDQSCALGDIDHNGTIDLVTIENTGFVKAWNLSTPYVESNVPWMFAGGNLQNNNYLAPTFEKPVTVTDAQLPENSVYNYPNPAKNSTTIRYHLNSESQVKINIYDLMGDCIKSISVGGIGHTDNEYVWDCSDVASGVYYCRVEADSGSEKVWRLFKIAIVK